MSQSSSFVLTLQEQDPMKLSSLVDQAKSKARVPISGFQVGAVGLGSSGLVYLGANVEFLGLPLHHSIHGEQFLIANLALNSEPSLTHLAASAVSKVFEAPCGHCRQFLQEILEAQEIKILIKNQEDERFVSLDSLLPRRFGPYSLISQDSPLLLQKRDNGLTLVSDLDEGLCEEALAAANRAYAPYSESPSGVAVKDCDGNVYKGWYMESVAYNPSLGPVQVALVDFVARSGDKGFDTIVEAVLVEKKDAKVSQEKTTRMILETIASTNPKCDIKVVHCQ
ncbi:unnamed protein product [Cochlearia groenlandica]